MIVFSCLEIDDPKIAIVHEALEKNFPEEEANLFKNFILHLCVKKDQLIYRMLFNWNPDDKERQINDKVLNQFDPLIFIYHKGMIDDLAENGDLSLLRECLESCNNNEVLFALKKGLIKSNRYAHFYITLDDSLKEKIGKNNVPTKLNIKFLTEITDVKGNPLEVDIYDINSNEDLVYELRTKDNIKLGKITIEPNKENVTILNIKSFVPKEKMPTHINVLGTLHEFAVRESFRLNLNGHVVLKAKATKNSAESFLLGYRYHDQDKMAYTCPENHICGELKNLLPAYFEAKKNYQALDEILVKLEKLEKDLKEHLNDFPDGVNLYLAFDKMRGEAKKVLEKEKLSMQEVMDYGVYFDKNTYLEKIVANNPMWHPDLGPLLDEYFENHVKGRVNANQDLIKKIESPLFGHLIQAIYKEMDAMDYKTNSKIMSKNFWIIYMSANLDLFTLTERCIFRKSTLIYGKRI